MNNLKNVILLISLARIAWIDLCNKQIPNQYLKELLLCRFLLLAIEETIQGNPCLGQNLIDMLIGGLYGGGILLTCFLITKKSVGGGDVKLFTVLGIYIGGEKILDVFAVSIFLAFFFCVMKLFLGKLNLKSQMSFGPFVFLAVLVDIFVDIK